MSAPALLTAYYYASQPWRAVQNSFARCRGAAPVSVLFYHRVANTTPNDWTISEGDFAQHVRYLQRHYDLISLEEAQQRIRAGKNHRQAVSITFDDGYADNCAFALPLLLRERIPVTYFVTLKNVVDRVPFPHDVKAGQPLEANTTEQIRSLAAAGVEIGGHTRTHPNLGSITDEATLHDEVIAASQELESITHKPVRYFAFPFGLPQNLNDRAIDLARRHGLLGVCSAYGGYNFPGGDPFHLQRIHGDPELIRLKNWLTIDPRKRGIRP